MNEIKRIDKKIRKVEELQNKVTKLRALTSEESIRLNQEVIFYANITNKKFNSRIFDIHKTK